MYNLLPALLLAPLPALADTAAAAPGGQTLQFVATAIFVIAILHTFSTKLFAHLAHIQPKHAGLWHLLGEVEAVFGFWAFVLIVFMVWQFGSQAAVDYLESLNFTEPMFVFAIMVIAASRPILNGVIMLVGGLSKLIPVNRGLSVYFLALAGVPLLGSFITEPAAMTLAALLLRERFFQYDLSERLKYATIGLLFVNVSIGGTLTNFAAPPVLMVASKWQWDSWFMFSHFGWKAATAAAVGTLAVTWLFRKEIASKGVASTRIGEPVPLSVSAIHVAFLALVVVFAHHPVVFMALFLFFLGYTEAYKAFQDRLILREGLMVAFFLAGLVALGGLQQWWLQQALTDVQPTVLYFIATGLTAITDNAALTYLASLVQGVGDDFKYAVVAGAVTGGGLTVIANAPNPAGMTILKPCFKDEAVSPLGLFLAATPPTLLAVCAFMLL
ncbi:MAG: putative Na+/H+ antiporter [Azonexaceae bacterium]|nr:putative Na+/H+ antiporter [Azonexaceae bacterium]